MQEYKQPLRCSFSKFIVEEDGTINCTPSLQNDGVVYMLHILTITTVNSTQISAVKDFVNRRTLKPVYTSLSNLFHSVSPASINTSPCTSVSALLMEQI